MAICETCGQEVLETKVEISPEPTLVVGEEEGKVEQPTA